MISSPKHRLVSFLLDCLPLNGQLLVYRRQNWILFPIERKNEWKNSVVYHGTFSENDMEALNWWPFVGALGSGEMFPVLIHYSQRSLCICSVMLVFPPVHRPRVCRDPRFLQL